MAAIDKKLVRRYFARSLDTYAAAAVVQREMAARLAGCWRRAAYGHIVELGAGVGLLTDRIAERLEYERLTVVELVPECARFYRDRPRTEFVAADLERWELPAGVDLITANAALQWVDDLPALLRRFHAALAPGGELAFATFGPETLRELRPLGGGGLTYHPLAELRALLTDAGLAVNCAESEMRTVEFASPLEILRHLRATGVGAPGAGSGMWTRKRVAELGELCARPGGGWQLTYQPLWLAAEKTRESKS